MYNVSQKVYHPITNDNFNSDCPILIIFATEWCFSFLPDLLSVLTLPCNTLGPEKSQV